MSQNNPDAGPFHIAISDNRLSAVVHIKAGVAVEAIAIIAKLNALKISNINLATLNECLATRGAKAVSIFVASGIAPVDERPARVDYRLPLADDQNGIVARVEVGQVVASFTAAVPGSDGRDVFDQPIPAKKGPPPVQLGKNLVLTKGNVTATAKGSVRLRDGCLSVEPLLDVHGENNNGPTQVDFAGDIAVKGSLGAAWQIRSAGSIIVAGAVEAAQLNAMGSIHVRGGIIGMDKGKCVTDRDLWSRFLSHVCIVAGGDVNAKGEIVHSQVTCAGRVTAMGGPVLGGKVMASRGIHCKTIGNAAGTPTIVEAGTDQIHSLIIAASKAAIEASGQRSRAIKEKIGPLLKHLKNLTPQQRERVTELIYEAEELDAQIETRETELKERCRLIRETTCDEIVVNDTLYHGVTVRLSRLETMIRTALKGPLKVITRKIGGATEMVLVEEGGAGYTLDSRPIGEVSPSSIGHGVAQNAA